jgi:hypothetical protein
MDLLLTYGTSRTFRRALLPIASFTLQQSYAGNDNHRAPLVLRVSVPDIRAARH